MALGKGLDALWGDTTLQDQAGGSVTIPVAQIEPGLNQPRKHFDEEALAGLAESIRQHGIIQPSGGSPQATTRSSPENAGGGPPAWRALPRSRPSSSRPTTAWSWSWA